MSGRDHLKVRTERIVPPAGEDYAFDRDVVEVYASPTGRSIRLFVDGAEVDL